MVDFSPVPIYCWSHFPFGFVSGGTFRTDCSVNIDLDPVIFHFSKMDEKIYVCNSTQSSVFDSEPGLFNLDV